jgi:hypothetical protein
MPGFISSMDVFKTFSVESVTLAPSFAEAIFSVEINLLKKTH